MSEMEKGMISDEALNKVAGGVNSDEILGKLASSLNVDKGKLTKGLEIAGAAVLSTAALASAGTGIGIGIKKLHDNKIKQQAKSREQEHQIECSSNPESFGWSGQSD